MIVTDEPPIFAASRRLAGDRLATAKQEFEMLLEKGVLKS